MSNDSELRTAIRAVQRSGGGVEMICALLDDLRLGGLHKVSNYTNKLIRGWRNKQVQRAMKQSEEELLKYVFIAASSNYEHKLSPTRVVKSRSHIAFHCVFKVEHEISFSALSLINDLKYNFGRQKHNGNHLYPGNQFNETFILKEL